MSDSGIEFSTAVSWYEILKALHYGKEKLSRETFCKVKKAFKRMIFHILIWVLIAVVIGIGIDVICSHVSDVKLKNLFESCNATHWVMGVNLDIDLPNQRSSISEDELAKITDLTGIGIIAGMVVALLM